MCGRRWERVEEGGGEEEKSVRMEMGVACGCEIALDGRFLFSSPHTSPLLLLLPLPLPLPVCTGADDFLSSSSSHVVQLQSTSITYRQSRLPQSSPHRIIAPDNPSISPPVVLPDLLHFTPSLQFSFFLLFTFRPVHHAS